MLVLEKRFNLAKCFFNILLTSTFDCVGVDAFSHGGLYDVVEEFACSEGMDNTVFVGADEVVEIRVLRGRCYSSGQLTNILGVRFNT